MEMKRSTDDALGKEQNKNKTKNLRINENISQLLQMLERFGKKAE